MVLIKRRGDEFAEARAAAEAVPKLGVPSTLLPLPLGAPARAVAALAGLRAETPDTFFNAINDRPIPHANWDAWLADDFDHVNGRLDNFADATSREFARWHAGAEYAAHMLLAPLLSELTELKAVQLVNWRQELRLHAEAELALYDAEMAVKL